MKQFKTVFKFEYTNYIKSKAFIVITVILLLIVLIGGNFPTIKRGYDSLFKKDMAALSRQHHSRRNARGDYRALSRSGGGAYYIHCGQHQHILPGKQQRVKKAERERPDARRKLGARQNYKQRGVNRVFDYALVCNFDLYFWLR